MLEVDVIVVEMIVRYGVVDWVCSSVDNHMQNQMTGQCVKFRLLIPTRISGNVLRLSDLVATTLQVPPAFIHQPQSCETGVLTEVRQAAAWLHRDEQSCLQSQTDRTGP